MTNQQFVAIKGERERGKRVEVKYERILKMAKSERVVQNVPKVANCVEPQMIRGNNKTFRKQDI